MSNRGLTTAVNNALDANIKRLALFVEMIFDSGPLRLWSGVGDKTFLGNVYTGVGQLGGVERVEEFAGDIRASGVVFTISGIPSARLSLALSEHFQSRPVTLWLGIFDDNWDLIPDEIFLFGGRMDYPVIEESGATATISVFAESRLIDLERPRVRRYTNEDQQQLFPGDRGLEFVSSLQNKEIIWKS